MNQMKATRERWRELCLKIGVKYDPDPDSPSLLIAVLNIDSSYQKIVGAYSGPDRHYHDTGHINDCLTRFDEVKHLFTAPDVSELALWLHDVVYDTKISNNEEESAIFADTVRTQLGIPPDFRAKTMSRILSTTHDHIPRNPDNRLVVDIDLAGLAAPWDKFLEDAEKIRAEYKATPEAFRIGRVKFFKKFLSGRPAIYTTDYFRTKCEAQAQENIKRYLAENDNPA